MSQPFSMRYPLIDFAGNNGSLDGDPAAAYRYTESKLSAIGYAMLDNLDKDTVEFVPNFDGTKTEPTVLSGLICNLLLNGCSGIAVGMACNLVPHNLNEVYDALIYYIDQINNGKEIDKNDILSIIKGPDFPIGGSIIGTKGIREYLLKGSGSVLVRANYTLHTSKKDNRESFIFTSIPYKTNKAEIVKSIDQLRIDGIIPEIKEVRDESSKDELVRIVVDLKKDVNKDVVLNKLFQKTRLQTSIAVNNTVLVDGRQPIVADIDTILTSFLSHSVNVTMNYLTYEDNKLNVRLNIVNGILKAIDHIDDIIEIIRNSDNEFNDIKAMNIFDNDEQVKAVLDISLKNLSRMNNQRYVDEQIALNKKHTEYTNLLNDQTLLLNYIKTIYENIKKRFGDDRRTEIVESEYEVIDDEDLIDDEMLVISYSNNDIIKAVSETDYKVQNRNGRGTSQYLNESENDSIKNIIVTNNKDTLLFFTSLGRCHTLKAYRINKTSRNAKGKHINNYVNLDAGERIISVLGADKNNIDNDLVFITQKGTVKRMSFELLPKRGSAARVLPLEDNDSLTDVVVANDNSKIFIITANGKALVTNISKIRPMGRMAKGVKGMKIAKDDKIIKVAATESNDANSYLLTITENGFAKCTPQSEFRTKGRGGQGVKAHKVTNNSGAIVSGTIVTKDEDLFVSTRNGQMIRIDLGAVRSQGKTASGVRVVKLLDDDIVASIATLADDTDMTEEQEVNVQ